MKQCPESSMSLCNKEHSNICLGNELKFEIPTFLPTQETSLASYEHHNEEVMSIHGDESPIKFNMESSNFSQLHNHYDYSKVANEDLINQLTSSLRYPDMVIRRSLPLPDNIY